MKMTLTVFSLLSCCWLLAICTTSVTTYTTLTHSNSPREIMSSNWEEWSLEELERQMSPSRWNPTKTPDEVIQQYINVSLEGTTKSRQEVSCELDNAYGTTTSSQKYDLYGLNLPDDSPIFFYIHGGYWQEGSKDISGHFARLNKANGYKSIAFGYTLAPEAKIEQMQLEVLAALEKVVKDHPKSKLVLAGHSAGGQLVAHLLLSSAAYLPSAVANNIAGLVLFSGVYDLRPLVKTYVNAPLKMTPQEATSLSALLQPFTNPTQLDFENLQILVVVGGYDSTEFQRQSSAYYEKLKDKIPNTSFWKSEADDHFTLIENLAEETSPVAKKVQEFLSRLRSKNNASEVTINRILPISVIFLALLTIFM